MGLPAFQLGAPDAPGEAKTDIPAGERAFGSGRVVGVDALAAGALGVALPYLLAFTAGAMMYVVVEELIPETAQGRHTNLSTIGFALGFVLMMVMDVMLN